MSDHAIRFWLTMFHVACMAVALQLLAPMIAHRRFSMRRAIWLMTATSVLAFSLVLKAKYYP